MKIILKRWTVTFFCLVALVVMESCYSNSDVPIQRSGSGRQTSPCGDFHFALLDTIDTDSENGIDSELTFSFTPTRCGDACSCNPLGFIQITRTISMVDDSPKFRSTQQRERATSDGWYIDRRTGNEWGYYGRRDDNSFEASVTSGTHTTPASLRDTPNRPERDDMLGILWEAVTVPVCITGGCEIKPLGYYYWSWAVTKAGVVQDIQHHLAQMSFIQTVKEAIQKWNSESDEWGTHLFPDSLIEEET